MRSLFCLFSCLTNLSFAASFLPTGQVQRLSEIQLTSDESSTSSQQQAQWLHCGLLFSSFTDGVEKNEQAKEFLRRGVQRALLMDALDGGDVAAAEHQQQSALTQLRVVYVPTALYALRRDSTNTPGKQRQRARADGKKRRDQFIAFLRNEIVAQTSNLLRIDAVTLDLDDASVKQGTTTTTTTTTGMDGRQLLQTWKPHIVYVEGGNTFWLQYCVEKGNWRTILQHLLTQPGTVYCGKSAGAILAGTTINTAYWKGWDDPLVVPGGTTNDDDDDGTTKPQRPLPGLNLLGGSRSIFPHMNDSWKEVVMSRRQSTNHSVDLLTDFDVLCVDGEKKELLFTTAAAAVDSCGTVATQQ